MIGMYILDVSGHGVASALLSVSLSRLLTPPPDPASILVRAATGSDQPRITPPAEVAAHLNRLFPFDVATEQLTTLILGVLNTASGKFRYVSAGHPAPIHVPGNGDPNFLESEGNPIGLTDEPYEERVVHLKPADRLYLYSDGLAEAMNPVGELFGNSRLLDAVARGSDQSLPDSVKSVLDEIARWRGAEKPQDDISLLAVEISH